MLNGTTPVPTESWDSKHFLYLILLPPLIFGTILCVIYKESIKDNFNYFKNRCFKKNKGDTIQSAYNTFPDLSSSDSSAVSSIGTSPTYTPHSAASSTSSKASATCSATSSQTMNVFDEEAKRTRRQSG